MKRLLILLIILSPVAAGAQNLVPNPGFESYSSCPNSDNQINRATPWVDVVPTSDFYNCSYQDHSDCPNGRTGTGYAGVSAYRPSWSTSYREYIGAPLLSTLVAGVTYYCEYWVRLRCDKCWTTDAMGAWFTAGQPADPAGTTMVFYVTPQLLNTQYRQLTERFTWMKICGTFTATGGENFITIGSFKDDTQSSLWEMTNCSGNDGVHWSYYHIDDVLLVQWDSTINYACDDTTVYENPNEDPNQVYEKECEVILPNVITPNADGFNDWFIIPDTALQKWNLKIYDRWGVQVDDMRSSISNGWNGKKNGVDPVQDGVYFYLLTSPSQKCYKKGTITVLNN